MVNRQKIVAGTLQSIHETIVTEHDLSYDWIIPLWDYPPEWGNLEMRSTV